MNTKLILVILSDRCERVVHQLLETGYRVTELSSTGGFLRRGSTTLVIGVDAGQVEAVLAMIRELCPSQPDASEHNATIFVLDASQFLHI